MRNRVNIPKVDESQNSSQAGMDFSNDQVVLNSESLEMRLEKLRQTYKNGKTRSSVWRKTQLKALLKLLRENEEDIYKALYDDLGKPRVETYRDEGRIPLLFFPASGEVVPEPLGLVLIFSSWNFPLDLALEPVIGAISAGNTMVLKPSELAPSCSSFLANTIPRYLDNDAIKVIEGGPDVGAQLLEHKWDKIFFTGNPRVGRIVMTAAAKHLTPVTLELGGKCPAIVDSHLSSSNLKTLCILVVNKRHFERLTNLLRDPGVLDSIVHGGSLDEAKLLIEPTILLDPPLEAEIVTEEIFGPLLPVITVKSIDESIEFINQRPKPLALYAFTNDENLKKRVVSQTSSGSVTFNDVIVHLVCDELPFGGVGQSGFGKYHGKYSFDTFSHGKGVLRRSFLIEIGPRFPPWNDFKLAFVKLCYEFDYFGLLLLMLGLKRY
ncbi:hypothetical protein C5167_010208 [Papaver somniferum]|uniref:Aldehyde dehydrogenase n=1 Tax=Papaver somniferum TaxID=3469 RepID=A0A4Y7K2F8_PAPSO|nr:hypothetical protein C5167_010208 [Papaver somniferum]